MNLPTTMKNTWWCLLLTLVPLTAVAQETKSPPAEYDAFTGLRIAPGWEQVRNHCIMCHSAQQFLQQSGSRNTWDSILKWMVLHGGMRPLEPGPRNTILDYLASNYGAKEATRRPPLPAHLMPPNPYVKPAPVAPDAAKETKHL